MGLIDAHIPSVAFSIISVTESALPGSSFFAAHAATFGVPWVSLTSGLNFVLTILITIRLLLYRRSMAMVATSDFAAMYTGIIAILVESAAPFTVAGILFAVLLGKDHPGQLAASQVWGTFVVSMSYAEPFNSVNFCLSGPCTTAYYPSCCNGACVDKAYVHRWDDHGICFAWSCVHSAENTDRDDLKNNFSIPRNWIKIGRDGTYYWKSPFGWLRFKLY
jgi:hypothetical protein